jgi:hypothetical protein
MAAVGLFKREIAQLYVFTELASYLAPYVMRVRRAIA